MTAAFTAGPGHEGERLDVCLAEWLGESRSQASARIDRGEVRIGGEVASKSDRLSAGDRVAVTAPPEPERGAAGAEPPPVRWEDEHLMVVSKPAGLVVHPGVGNPAGTMVQALAEAGYPLAPAGGEHRPGIVHRLDKDTSGLLVVAKTDEVHIALVRALKRRDVERTYVALVEGRLPSPSGRIEVPIGRDPADRKRFAAVADGRPSTTHWQVEAVGEVDTGSDVVAVSRIRCRLETGRTHQIRVHLSYAGNPVVGDRTYGARRDLPEALGVDRFCLHAARLAFEHPVTGRQIEVEDPVPPDIHGAMARADRSVGT